METIDLSQVEQLIDTSQTRAIAYAINYAAQNHMDGKTNMKEIVSMVEHDIETKGLDILAPKGSKKSQ